MKTSTYHCPISEFSVTHDGAKVLVALTCLFPYDVRFSFTLCYWDHSLYSFGLIPRNATSDKDRYIYHYNKYTEGKTKAKADSIAMFLFIFILSCTVRNVR